MWSKRQSPKRRVLFQLGLVILVLITGSLQAQNLVILLRNGDRVSGKILSETTNQVVFQSSWHNVLVISTTDILSREVVPAGVAAGQIAVVQPAGQGTNMVAATNVVGLVLAPLVKPVVVVPKPKTWVTEAQVGVDMLFSQTDRQLYSGRLKTLYTEPPWRNTFDYQAAYGKTEGLVSDDRMYGSLKTEWGFHKNLYLYNLAGTGFDKVRKINFRYEVGPGLGVHLFTRTNFLVNTEMGGNYQAQYRSDGTRTESFYLRFAEDAAWKITPRITWDEKFEYFPQVDRWAQYRFRVETNLRYALLNNLALILTVADSYDTITAVGVPQNSLQITSSLGFKF